MVVGWRFCNIFATNISINLFIYRLIEQKKITNKLKYDLKTNY